MRRERKRERRTRAQWSGTEIDQKCQAAGAGQNDVIDLRDKEFLARSSLAYIPSSIPAMCSLHIFSNVGPLCVGIAAVIIDQSML